MEALFTNKQTQLSPLVESSAVNRTSQSTATVDLHMWVMVRLWIFRRPQHRYGRGPVGRLAADWSEARVCHKNTVAANPLSCQRHPECLLSLPGWQCVLGCVCFVQHHTVAHMQLRTLSCITQYTHPRTCSTCPDADPPYTCVFPGTQTVARNKPDDVYISTSGVVQSTGTTGSWVGSTGLPASFYMLASVDYCSPSFVAGSTNVCYACDAFDWNTATCACKAVSEASLSLVCVPWHTAVCPGQLRNTPHKPTCRSVLLSKHKRQGLRDCRPVHLVHTSMHAVCVAWRPACGLSD